jgi:hypothetical protein
MADKILHKRSLTPGSVPTTSSLETGELAINVYDGKLFLRQSGSVEQIITVGESASFATTASYVETAQTASYVLNAVSSSYALTASYAMNGGGGGVTYIRRSDYTSSLDPNINYLYLGEAPSGSAESATVWDISRLSISASGDTTTQTTSSAAWTDRYIVTYL